MATTASRHFVLSSRTSARTTMAVAVVRSSAATARTRCQMSSGMRNFRGGVSGTTDPRPDVCTHPGTLAAVGGAAEVSGNEPQALCSRHVCLGTHVRHDPRGALNDPVCLGLRHVRHGSTVPTLCPRVNTQEMAS